MFTNPWDFLTFTLDIVLVFILIFILIKLLIKEKTGRTILNIILVAYVVYFLTIFLNLTFMNVILSYVLNWGIIIIVVIFAKEIREFFERNTWSNWYGLKKQSMNAEEVNEFNVAIDAISKMATEKRGAFLVFEMNDDFDEYTQNSTRLNSEMNSALIESIFVKESSLHDGALIIKNNKITYASVYFPIDLGLEIDNRYGTRHRAALTISNLKDCLAIIVSEETGEIAITYGGKLYSNMDEASLKAFIFEKFKLKDNRKNEKVQ